MKLSGWIDSHAHLSDLSKTEINTIISKFSTSNIKLVLNTATNLKSSQTVLEQTQFSECIYGAVGVSPFDCENLNENYLYELETLLQNRKIISIGEIGLDGTNPKYPELSLQYEVFIKQLRLAKKLNIPVILHSRGKEQKVLEILLEEKIKKAVFHCFTGDENLVPKIIAAGYLISFSGIVTFKNNPLHKQIKATPLTSLLIETDAPYLAPVPYRGKTNSSELVFIIGEKIAEIKEISKEELIAIISNNFSKLFF